MRIASRLEDRRINAENLLVEMTIREYEALTKGILHKNEFQRRRVSSSKTVYALLREDILKGCVIPPVVLALTADKKLPEFANDHTFAVVINELQSHLVILDGLQRTYTILDLLTDLRAREDALLLTVLDSKIRVEIYLGLNRLGILYRMLTLNTGQTPMSLRQQIEILYLDYVDHDVEGIRLIRETDEITPKEQNQYNFKDVVQGFISYLDRDELPIDKLDLLENINSLEKLSKENQDTQLFEEYLRSLSAFIKKLNELCGGTEVGKDFEEEFKTLPFGKNVNQVFKKPQAMSGLGAALGKLIDNGQISSLPDVLVKIDLIDCPDPSEFLIQINKDLNWLKSNSKKIGNAQRSFFSFFFRDLFNPDSDSYLRLFESSSSALRKYRAHNF